VIIGVQLNLKNSQTVEPNRIELKTENIITEPELNPNFLHL